MTERAIPRWVLRHYTEIKALPAIEGEDYRNGIVPCVVDACDRPARYPNVPLCEAHYAVARRQFGPPSPTSREDMVRTELAEAAARGSMTAEQFRARKRERWLARQAEQQEAHRLERKAAREQARPKRW